MECEGLTAKGDALNLGFLTVANEPQGFTGGYLVTNQWGRPIEFRLSTPVRPNRVQQILYAETLLPYICGELIGKTLIDKTNTDVQAVITNTAPALDLRRRLEFPVVLIDPSKATLDIVIHPGFPADRSAAQAILDQLAGTMDLREPFTRVRDAMAEAKKIGVNNRG
jgi:hypothetical protein